MLACVVHGPKDLRLDDLAEPEPGRGEVAISVSAGGICGSDLHYYNDGAVGAFRLVEPMVLGHEIAGHVVALGEGVAGPPVGAAVAVHPATPCDACRECLDGRRNVCQNVRYLGSAARVPHVQGGLAELIVVPASQVRVVPRGLSLDRAVLAEPLAVALHAVHRAEPAAGGRALVTGAGPIGLLVVLALRQAGVTEVIVTDLLSEPLELAKAVGADVTVRVGHVDDLAWPRDFDVAIEASGSPAGLRTCLERARPGGTVVQLGLLPPGDVTWPGARVAVREISVRGSFRFDAEFDQAISLLADGLDAGAIVTHKFPLAQADEAFVLASNRALACKVLLEF
jgi:L-idonate 5-dehydrogenase